MESPVCEVCGERPAVDQVLVHGDGPPHHLRMCAECRASRLGRHRVRTNRSRRHVIRWVAQLGYPLIVIGVTAIVILGYLALRDALSDDRSADCVPSATVSCSP